MGWDGHTISIGVLLDSHGGDKERMHDKLYEELIADIEKIAESDKYKDIVTSVRNG